jgi:hypothetical protein
MREALFDGRRSGMSDTQLGKQCLTHYNPQHIQVRKDFLDLCAYDKRLYNNSQRKSGKTKRDEPNQECMAKILRLLETLTDGRKAHWQVHNEELIAKKRLPLKEPAEYRIELAYSTIERLLYNTCGESTIRNSMAVLIQRGYVVRYQKNKASVPYYALNIPVLQTALYDQKEQTEDEVLNVTPSDANDFLGDDKVLNVQTKGVNATPKPVHSTAKGVNATPNNIVGNTASNITSKSCSTRNHNAPVLSNAQVNQSSQENAEESNPVLPPAEETRRETLNACLESGKVTQVWFKDNEQQALWVVASQAFTLQKKRVPEMILESWDKPTTRQREQITEIVQKLKALGRSVQEITPERIEQAWVAKMERDPFLKRDPIAKLGNMRDALVERFAIPQEAPQPDMPELTAEEAEEKVLWTEHPEGMAALHGTIEQMTRSGILKRVPRRIAIGYDLPGAEHFTIQEEAEHDAVRAIMRELAIAV